VDFRHARTPVTLGGQQSRNSSRKPEKTHVARNQRTA
jgi:hypothetical protein